MHQGANSPKISPRVTVIIPTMGRASLSKAVQSVLAQTFPVYEIIIVLDLVNSNSPILEVSPLCKIAYSSIAGPAAARNRGLEIANGDLVAFLDDDDYWDKNKIELQIEYMNFLGLQLEDKWLITSRVLFLREGHAVISPPTVFSGDQIVKSLYHLGFRKTRVAFYTPTWIFPLQNCSIKFDEKLTNREDVKFLIDLQQNSFRVFQLSEPLTTISKSIRREILRENSREILSWARFIYGVDKAAGIKFLLGMGLKLILAKGLYNVAIRIRHIKLNLRKL